MNYLFIIFSVFVSLGSLKYAFKQRNQKLFLKRKYSPIKDIDQYVIEEKEKLNKEKLFLEDVIRKERFDSENVIKEEKIELANNKLIFENSIRDERDKIDKKKINVEKEILEFKSKIDNLKNEEKDYQNRLKAIKRRLDLAFETEESFLLNCGYYEPNYFFQKEKEWESLVKSINTKQKKLLLNFPSPEAYSTTIQNEYCSGVLLKKLLLAYQTFEIGGSQTDGSLVIPSSSDLRNNGNNFQKQFLTLMLRAFNAECDSFIRTVNWKNIKLQTQRIEASFNSINELGMKYHFCSTSVSYKNLKITELQCMHEYEEWKQKEKEEQRRIRQQMR